MKALVTGAGGFLGLYVVEQLVARGDRVRALCRGRDARLEALGAETVLADLRNRQAVVDACRGMDAVFHIGGIAGMAGPWKQFHETNVLGTQHVVEGCKEHGVGRLVYTSSPSVTFNGKCQRGVDETVPYARRWLCHYPRSKALAEQHVLTSNETDGLLTCALRPHLIWGPRDRHLIPRVLDHARSGRLCRVGNGTNLVDTVYVENAASAHLLAADALVPGSPVPGRAYFISQGEPVNCWTWIDEILALAGLPPVRKTISTRAAWRLGTFYEILHHLLPLRRELPMSRFLAMQMSSSHYFDITRAREDFGYRPEVSMAEGMRRLAVALSFSSEG